MFRRFMILAALLAAATPAYPQGDPHLSETVSVGYVMVPFTVLSSKGNPITDLRENEVSLEVDGVPVRGDVFEKSENAPVSFTILLDGSGSMGLAGKMEAAQAAVEALTVRRQAGD